MSAGIGWRGASFLHMPEAAISRSGNRALLQQHLSNMGMKQAVGYPTRGAGGERAEAPVKSAPDCFGGLQPEKGAGFLAGDVALGLPLPHHQGLQLKVVHRQQACLCT